MENFVGIKQIKKTQNLNSAEHDGPQSFEK